MQQKPHRMGRIIPGSFASVIRQFMASERFLSKEQATRRNWSWILRLAEEEAGLGGCSIQVIRPAIIQGFLDALAETPGKQKVARTVLKQVEKFALLRDLMPHPFMTGTEVIGSDGGHEPWTIAEVELAVSRARSDLSRVVILALHTGQRGSDVVRMRPADIEERYDPIADCKRRGINVEQQKTGKKLWVPFTAEFEAILATWERRLPLAPFVLRPDGKFYTRPQLSTNWNIERDNNPALKPLKERGLVLHGLRATAVVRARRLGLTDLQIADIYGMSAKMVSRYSRLSDQGDNAMAALRKLNRTSDEQNIKIFQKVYQQDPDKS